MATTILQNCVTKFYYFLENVRVTLKYAGESRLLFLSNYWDCAVEGVPFLVVLFWNYKLNFIWICFWWFRCALMLSNRYSNVLTRARLFQSPYVQQNEIFDRNGIAVDEVRSFTLLGSVCCLSVAFEVDLVLCVVNS